MKFVVDCSPYSWSTKQISGPGMGRAVVFAQLLQGAILLKLDTSEGQQSGVAPLKAWKRMAVDGSRVGSLIRLAMICFNHQPFMSAHQTSISGGVALPQFLVGNLFGAGLSNEDWDYSQQRVLKKPQSSCYFTKHTSQNEKQKETRLSSSAATIIMYWVHGRSLQFTYLYQGVASE